MVIIYLLICSLVGIGSPMHTPRRPKRIAYGEPVPSMSTYSTHYYVQIRRTWACTTDQTDHEDSLSRCQNDYHRCGGTLIHPEFILTAAHCIMYYEVYVKIKGQQIDDWVREKTNDGIGNLWNAITDSWTTFERWVVGLFIVPKPKHTVYSDWSLFMGSTDYFKMKQRRHVTNVFPHRRFPTRLISTQDEEKFELTLNSWHDVALLRACEAFKMKSGEIELAPMLNTVELLREQYERIVQRSTVCLYIGFGDQDNYENEAAEAGYPHYNKNLLLHTWRSSKCNADCNYYQLENNTKPHTCFLCSWHLGPKLGVVGAGDSGGPVTCEHQFVATITKASFQTATNYSSTGSYPLHCIKQSITAERLDYYKTVNHSHYHPLSGTRFRRLPLPPD